jgi:putative ABC transport system permease protein
VLVLALGIGATTAIFSAVHSLLLKPLPLPDAGRLVLIWERNVELRESRTGPSGSNYTDWKEQNRSFEDLAAIEPGTATLTGLGEPEQIPGMRVTSNFLTMTGAKPILGRIFTPEDGRGGRNNILVITRGYWMRRFGGDPGVIGKVIQADGLPYTVVGVLADMWQPLPCEVLVPWPDDELRRKPRMAHDLGVLGKLKPGVTPTQAEADLNGIQRDLARRYVEMRGWSATVVPMQSAITEFISPALWTLFAAVAFLLLIACANVANLLLARAVARSREVAIRAALGAGTWRLMRQLLTESVLLSLAGGALGVLLALWGVEALRVILPANVPLPDAAAEITLGRIGVDAGVLIFALILSLSVGLLFGLAPAWHARKSDIIATLKSGARTLAGATNRARRILLAGEVALAVVLLTGAALTVASFARLHKVNTGFRTDHVVTMQIELPTDSKYQSPADQAQFFERVVQEIQSTPGVSAAAAVNVLPMAQEEARIGFSVERSAETIRRGADLRRITPEFFATMEIPLRKGRAFEWRDGANSAPVVIIDEPLARQVFGDEDPLGRTLRVGNHSREIVGVASAVHHGGLSVAPRPTLYVPVSQAPVARMELIIRTAADPANAVQSVKRAVWSIDPGQPVYRVRTLDEVVDVSRSASRVSGVLLTLFAAAAITLAALGIYGLMSYTVAQRQREIGIRMALGAQPGSILKLVVGDGVLLSLKGVGVGLIAAALLTRMLGNLLYGVSPTDPATYTATAGLVIAIAALASWLPARRASRIEPVEILRDE